jgi:murein DD-endopeptidase MepM/ murein hydrolase activator NlpD
MWWTALMAPVLFADGPDLKPPQVTVDYIFPPSPLIQERRTRLYYEMVITNYIPIAYQLAALDVEAGAKAFSFAGSALKNMTRTAGVAGEQSHSLEVAAGRTTIVFITLEFAHSWEVPAVVNNTVHLRSPDGVDHALTIEPVNVTNAPPIVIAPPLRGPDWLAGDSANNGPDAAHRRAVLLNHGHAYIAQRYAIDWVKYRIFNGEGVTWSGPEDKNTSYFCYDAPIYSIASGKVVEALDGIPENVPHSGKVAIDVNFANAAGNHVVVDIGYGLYALYAHMRPGTLRVKAGDLVKTGDLLGHVGNTGNSTEPHLHMHIDNQPSFLAGQGVPYEFDHFEASDTGGITNGPHDRMIVKGVGGKMQPFTDDYPAADAGVTFPRTTDE